MTPDIHSLYQVLDATWPAASTQRIGPWTIRESQGGGQRVGATTAETDFALPDIAEAEAAMATLNQPNLFMIRPGDAALDAALEPRGYAIKDPVALYLGAVERLTQDPLPRVAAFTPYPPLAIQRDIWAAGGIGPARLAVMQRAKGPKTTILARHNDQPAGTAFAAIHDNVAMLHAIEVVQAHRKQGVGTYMLRAAAFWAQDQGASYLALAVTRANAAARALYASQGMTIVGQYHYRKK